MLFLLKRNIIDYQWSGSKLRLHYRMPNSSFLSQEVLPCLKQKRELMSNLAIDRSQKYPTLIYILDIFPFYQKIFYVIVKIGAYIMILIELTPPDVFTCILLMWWFLACHVICFQQCDIFKCDPSRSVKCPFALGLDFLEHGLCHIRPSWRKNNRAKKNQLL